MDIKNNFAAIFDMDGVIANNSKFHFKSWNITAKKFGFRTMTEKYYKQKINGRKAEDTVKRLAGRAVSEKNIKLFVEQKEKIYRQIYRKHIKPVKGLLKFLEALKDSGIKIAMATSAAQVNINFVLGSTKTKKYFKHIINSSHVTHGKPHPEVYLKAAKLIKVNPKNCVVFEDALNGIESAQRARMKVVAVATTNRPQNLRHADAVIKDFTQISIGRLQELIS